MLDASPSRAASSSPPAPRARLDYLDGLRGLAALYVVCHHALMEINYRLDGGGLPRSLIHATSWLDYGRIGVDIFIVLSGYCLMLPVARSQDGLVRGGLRDFFRRRARRILPPYFAALALFLLVIGLVPFVSHAASTRWPGATSPFHWPILISHLLLVHNWNNAWTFHIDYPMWSVASEWQIYFLFPLVLLPLWRRFGSLAPVAAGFAFGIACFYGLPQINQACPWFVGLFALGMAAATVNFSPATLPSRWRTRLPWGIITALLTVVALTLCYLQIHGHYILNIVLDTLIGLAAASFLVAATRCLTEPGLFAVPLGLRLCASRGAVWLGTFSYSLYLVHAPIVAIVHDIAARFAPTPSLMLLALFGLGVPLSLAFAYLFYRLFERPFMPGHPHTDKQAAQAAIVSPAP